MNTSLVLQGGQLAAQMVLVKQKSRRFSKPTLPNGQVLPDIIAQATIEERHMDRLEITSHPIEQGAAITDHAFINPSEVILRLGWSNSGTPSLLAATEDIALSWAATVGGGVGQGIAIAGGITKAAGNTLLSVVSESAIDIAYATILHMYNNRAVFTLYTGKRIYDNMVCKMVSTETDYTQENSMIIMMECQEILLVNTQTVSLPANKQRNEGSTASPINRGTQQAIQK